MKKLLFTFLLGWMLMPMYAQNLVLDGTVTNSLTDTVEIGHDVYFYNTVTENLSKVTTNNEGYFSYEVMNVDDSLSILITTLDKCSGDTLTAYYHLEMSATYFPFYICADSVEGNCFADFTYQFASDSLNMDSLSTDSMASNDFIVEFTNLSEGENPEWYWDFGDGSYSTDKNPVHEYDSAGSYLVELRLVSDSCSDIKQNEVIIGVNNQDCYASFGYSYFMVTDSSITESVDTSMVDFATIQFWDYSSENALSWYWDFGDGSVSSERNPLHYYQENGEYIVTLIIATGSCEAVSEVVVYAGEWENPWEDDCYAYFYYDYMIDSSMQQDSAYLASLTMQFFDLSQGNPNNWVWDFGDGTISNNQNPIHKYDEEGEYMVTLSIETDSCESSIEMSVIVGEYVYPEDSIWQPENCMAMFYSEYTSEEEVAFFNHSYGEVVSFEWNFGDGMQSEEENPIHKYDATGEYLVSLFIETVDSCTSYFETILYIGNNDDSTSLRAFFVPELDELDVTFHNKSDGEIWNYYWDFGDGTSSVSESPKHIYEQEGIYLVTLGISNANEVKTYTIEMDLELGTFKGIVGNGTTGTNDNDLFDPNLIVYPVPVTSLANVGFKSIIEGQGIVKIISISGSVLSEEYIQIHEGDNKVKILTDYLGGGIYLLQLQFPDNNTKNFKFIK